MIRAKSHIKRLKMLLPLLQSEYLLLPLLIFEANCEVWLQPLLQLDSLGQVLNM